MATTSRMEPGYAREMGPWIWIGLSRLFSFSPWTSWRVDLHGLFSLYTYGPHSSLALWGPGTDIHQTPFPLVSLDYRTSKISVVKSAMSLLLTLIAIFLAQGEISWQSDYGICTDLRFHSVLEYLTQEDADDAVKRLDGKELRGASVRVELADVRVSVVYLRLSPDASPLAKCYEGCWS